MVTAGKQNGSADKSACHKARQPDGIALGTFCSLMFLLSIFFGDKSVNDCDPLQSWVIGFLIVEFEELLLDF